MRILVDSHVALWWLAGSDRLGELARGAIERAEDAYVSVVTPWELGIKRALGKLTMPDGLVEALRSGGFVTLDISAEHAVRALELPQHHRDPFDRILVAQALIDELVLVTADAVFDDYDVELVDARR